MSHYNLNFFTCVFGRYRIFIVPYITAALYHNPTAIAEILVDNIDVITDKQRKFLNTYFAGRWSVRAIPNRFRHWKYSKWLKSIRWLTTPKKQLKYTYIGDVDILIVEKDIYIGHERHAKVLDKPYSNIVRPNCKNMTGLHFVITDPYYKKINVKYVDSVIKKIEARKFSLKSLDERLLCMMVRKRIGIKNNPQYRPGHGLHLSPGRPIVKWADPSYLPMYNDFKSTVIWKDGLTIFDSEFIRILNRLPQAKILHEKDAILAKKILSGQYNEKQIKRLRDRRKKLRIHRHIINLD